ncbi:hypothetical protein JCM9140_4312 [Halalkalibacter wakoensis JCM 9140]|uniref:Uncharacterized protein n=1 Tax=Halalkalibacter wakoensis JCM 9140 TaxID=1236970 RepID=W4Q7Z8_9BACI|nr:hypothetical protein JCM9140_4312 [Halalkalibacter wakoensis JCM 9140]
MLVWGFGKGLFSRNKRIRNTGEVGSDPANKTIQLIENYGNLKLVQKGGIYIESFYSCKKIA